MVLEGALIHHLEVSKQGFVLADLPFKTTTNGFKGCINLYEEGTKSRRFNIKISDQSDHRARTRDAQLFMILIGDHKPQTLSPTCMHVDLSLH